MNAVIENMQCTAKHNRRAERPSARHFVRQEATDDVQRPVTVTLQQRGVRKSSLLDLLCSVGRPQEEDHGQLVKFGRNGVNANTVLELDAIL